MTKQTVLSHFPKRKWLENLLKTKIAFLLVMLLSYGASANIYSQNQRVSMKFENAAILDVLNEIKSQTGLRFIYSENKLENLHKIDVDAQSLTIEELLNQIFEHTQLACEFRDDVIMIVDKKAKFSKQAQQPEQRIIKGKVIDEEGLPLPGVSVKVKDSYLGTATAADGSFELKVPETAKALEFSFIGFTSEEVKLDDRKNNYHVTLVENITELGEVIKTGYQRIDRRKATSAIETITEKDLEVVGALSLDRMLEGKATGLMITNLSATPGAAARVRVRGGSTFTGNQSPLWVIDGIVYEDPVPLSASDINSFDNINLIGNALTGINPSDIAQINILKDASATAIYGTRAANGVISITTKRGKEGDPSLTYSGGLSLTRAPRYSDFELMNSKERIDVSREMYERNIGTSSTSQNLDRWGYEGALLNLWDGTYNFNQFQEQVSYLETLNADWFGALYRTAVTQQHSVSASGGGAKNRYYFSLGYDDQQGTEEGVGLNRITARANLDLDLRDNVLLSFQMNGSVQEATYNHSTISTFDEAYYTSRTIPVYGQDGDLAYQTRLLDLPRGLNKDIYGQYHILNEMQNSERNVTNKDLAISANLRWDFLDHFRLTSQFSYRNTTNLTEEWIADNTFYIAGLRTYDAFEEQVAEYIDNYGMVPFGGIYSGGMVSSNTYSMTNQLNYNRVFDEKHVINANLGYEMRSQKYWGVKGFQVPGYSHYYGRGFISLDSPDVTTEEGINFANYEWDNVINWMTTKNSSIYPTITDRLSNTVSMFGIFNYVYDNRYIFNFNVRSDGSNTFGQHERYKFKPTWSTSARWNIHNEAFWNRDGKIDELAFRASYGIRGTVPNTLPYLIISNYGLENASIYGGEYTASLVDFPNANLSWEKTGTLNLGLNYSLFGGRMSGALDYAYSKSTDLMQTRPISQVNGTSTWAYNAGSKDISSLEFSLRTVNVKTEKFGWSTYLNFSYEKDRVLDGFEGDDDNLSASNYLNGSIYRTGFPTNGFYSYQFDGLNEEGMPTFKNLDKTDLTATEQLQAMLVYEGTRQAPYYGGFGTEIRYGNFRLSAGFTFKMGYKTRLLDLYRNRTDNEGNTVAGYSMPQAFENMSSVFVNRWRQPGDEAHTSIPGLSAEAMTYGSTSDPAISTNRTSEIFLSGQSNAWDVYDLSDERVVKGDHIRLNSLSLSYNMPKSSLQTLGVKSMRLGLQMSNVAVFTFDKKLKGQDPEQVNSIGLPSLPTYSFSLNMSF